MLDELVERLLFFVPVGTTGDHHQRWTEIVFGALQLCRLSIDLAADEEEREEADYYGDDGGIVVDRNPHGASVAVQPRPSSSSSFPAVGVRIALTVIQCLWPVAQQVVTVRDVGGGRGGGHPSGMAAAAAMTERRQAKVRCLMERIRFVLRMSLLYNYWKDFADKRAKLIRERGEDGDVIAESSVRAIPPGLLLNGGLYYNQTEAGLSVPTLEDERRRIERIRYVGRRTGRKINAEGAGQRRQWERTDGNDDVAGCSERLRESTCDSRKERSLLRTMLPVVVGELLYCVRPLLQVEFQQHQHRRGTAGIFDERHWTKSSSSVMKLWISCLSLDMTSLFLLRDRQRRRWSSASSSTALPGNAITREEWDRRRWRLWLYLLRSPIWDLHMRPAAERVSDVAGRVPFIGGLIQNYLWDWLFYWKLYRAEEG